MTSWWPVTDEEWEQLNNPDKRKNKDKQPVDKKQDLN